MENFKAKYVIIYANHIWQSNNEWEATSRLDSDSYIVCSLVRDDNQLYSMVHPITKSDELELRWRDSIFDEVEPMKESTSIFDED